MKILKVLPSKTYSTFILKEDDTIAIKNGLTFFYKGIKYKVLENEKKNIDNLNKEFICLCKPMPRTTIHNYDDIDFLHINKIEREDPYTIILHYNHMKSLIKLKSPKECLNEFIGLRKMQREAMSSEEYYIKR